MKMLSEQNDVIRMNLGVFQKKEAADTPTTLSFYHYVAIVRLL